MGLVVDRRRNVKVLLVLESLVKGDGPEIVCVDVRSLLETLLLFVLGDTRVGVSHDGDEHVQESQVGQEGGNQEVDPNEGAIGALLKGVHTELAQSQQVLTHRGICRLPSEERTVKIRFLTRRIPVEHEDRVRKREYAEEEQDDEV